MVDIGNLSLGIQIPGMAALDALERRLAALDRAFGPPLSLNVNTSGAQRSVDEYIRVSQNAIAANRALSQSEMQLARDMQAAAQSRQQVVGLERVAANERVQIARTVATQETAIERTRIQQAEANARQRIQIEAQAARTIYQAQQAAMRQQSSGGANFISGRGAVSGELGGGVGGFVLGTAAVAAGGALTAGLVAATKASVDFNSQLQQSQIAFATFLGSEQAADAHIRDLARFAATTPFQFPDLLEASKRLQSMGFAAKDVIPDLTAIGNAVAAMGTGKEGIDRITLALGQMQQKGKVTGEELRQLSEAGINATQYIADALGKTTAETLALSQRGQISGRTGVNAIIAGLAGDPKFAGLMDKQSKSFAGSMSNIQDSAQMALAQGLRPLFEELNKDATALATFTASDDFTRWAADFATSLHDDISAVKDFGAAVADSPIYGFVDFLVAHTPNLLTAGRAFQGLSEAFTGNQATRNRVDAYVAGGGDIAKLRADSEAAIADLEGRSTRNPITANQNRYQLDQARETIRQLDQIAKEHAAEAADAAKFIGPPLPPGYSDQLKKATDGFNLAASAAADYHAKLMDIGKAQAQGAGRDDILAGILGITPTGEQATQSQIALARQHLQEFTAAWQQAATAINGVDISRGGIAGLAAQSDGLRKAREELARLGQSSAGLNAVSDLAATFKQITDAEERATAAMKGFDLTLSVTKGYMSDIGGLKSDFIAALDAAEKRRAAGIADQSDLDIINAAPDALSKLDNQMGRLQQHANADIIGKIKNLTDYADLDTYTRNIVDRLGGGKQIMLDVQSNVADIKNQIDDIVNQPHEATITLDLAMAAGAASGLPAWVMTALGLAAGGAPSGGPSTGGGGGAASPASVASGVANPAGWNQFSPLSMSQYQSIVAEGSGGRASPFDSPDMYAAVLAAAQQYGVDPRVLLAFTKAENNNATNISDSLLAANNYGGIKGPGGPMSPEGDTYRAFGSPQDFFNALAANLSTGAYAGDYQSGNLYGVAKRYVGSDSPGRVEDYARYASQYPAGAGGAPWDDPRFGRAMPGGTSGQSIVDAAMLDLGAKAFVDQCEKWIEEKVQAATGRRGATGTNEYDANAGLAHARQMGLEVSDPQPGDLVYYGDAANGHVAIYMGDGKQISTADRGGVAIHTEAVGAGARYVRVPGVNDTAAAVDPRNIDARLAQAAAAGAAGGIDVRLTVAAGAPDIGGAAAPSALDAKTATFFGRLVQAMQRQALAPFQAAVQQAMAASDPRDASASLGMFQSVLPMLDKRAQATGGPGGGPTLTDPERLQASNAALQQGLGFLAAWTTALSDIRDKTGNLAADEQKITDIIGGPMAADLNRELSVMADQAAIADRIAQLTQRKADLEASHAAVLQQRQREDTAEARAMTRQGWADQDAQQALTRRTNTENAAFTGISRRFEDRARALAFSQQVQATDLQNRLTDLQKQQQSTVYQRTAAETLLGAQAKGAGTNQAAAVLSARLAAMHEQDLAQKDLNTKAIDDIQMQIREQAKAANLESFNLEGERIAAQRKHEDILQGINDEGIREQDLRTARDRSHEIALEQIQDRRAAEDESYNLAISSIDKEIAAQQQLAADADASLKAAQDALSIWEQTGIDVGQVGTALSNTASQLINAAQQAAYYSSVAGLSTDTGVPYSQFPAPGASQYAGGTRGMYVTSGLVGDSPWGDTSNAEWVVGNFRVYSHADTVRMGKVGGANARYAGGTAKPVAPASPAGGGGTDLHMHFNGGAASLSEEDVRDIRRYVDGKVAAAERRMKYAGKNAGRAGGG